MPSTTAEDPVERRLRQFLSDCRTAARGGRRADTFTAERRALLDRLVPGWEGVDRDDIFSEHVHELAGWVNAHDGRMPSGQAKDPVERRHGSFLSGCRRAARGQGTSANTFTAERRALLDRLVPGWEGVDPETAFDGHVHALADWVNARDGQMPSRGAKDPVERRHGQFLGYCRTAARGGQGARAFSAERRALLDQHVPGWDAPRLR